RGRARRSAGPAHLHGLGLPGRHAGPGAPAGADAGARRIGSRRAWRPHAAGLPGRSDRAAAALVAGTAPRAHAGAVAGLRARPGSRPRRDGARAVRLRSRAFLERLRADPGPAARARRFRPRAGTVRRRLRARAVATARRRRLRPGTAPGRRRLRAGSGAHAARLGLRTRAGRAAPRAAASTAPPAARPSPTQRRGVEAEELALRHLERAGLRLVTRNDASPLGEIDLVMTDGAQWVFVEVRRRASAAFGGAAASVTSAKQRRIR